MAHVNEMLAVLCDNPLLEESSIAPDWLQSLTYLPSSGMYPLRM
jgi:hypothetical protein